MSSLRRNLNWLFVVLVLVSTLLLVWGLYSQWQEINKRHQLGQRSQVLIISSAMHALLNSQETLLTLSGRQSLFHWDLGQIEAADAILHQTLDINADAAGYVLLDADRNPVVQQWRAPPTGQIYLTQALIEHADCDASAEHSGTMVTGRPFQTEVLNRWLLPVCKAIADGDALSDGFITAALLLQGSDSFIGGQVVLGPTNIVQVIRESDLQPILWATSLDLPSGFLALPISSSLYQQATQSAERLSGQSVAEIRAGGQPARYTIINSWGQQIGMAIHNPRYRFWVLTQTSRSELIAQLKTTSWVYGSIYFGVLLIFLTLLMAINRAERKRRQELVYQASHDMLTRLPNRQSMTSDFEQMKQRYGADFALLFVDMDHFKAVNDGFGHIQGDKLLTQLGQRLMNFSVADERVARVGGDEFVLMTPETASNALLQRASSLVAQLTAPYQVGEIHFELGCSVGIAKISESGASLSDALRAADVAMYAAKRDPSSVRMFQPAMGQHYLENIQIEQRFRQAVEAGHLYMCYQMQMDAEERIIGIEALARWDDPELGPIEPQRFIAIAETSGFLGLVGDHILDCCMKDARVLDQELDQSLRLAINISVRQFLQVGFATRLIERIQQAGLNRIQPLIEITESLFIEDHQTVMNEVQAIRQAGISVALDDFGTGYSSLSLLRNLPVDELKIDKSFVANLEIDSGSQKLIQSIVVIGQNYELFVVAEGVETRRQFDILREAGCDAFQGYLFARPMRLEKLHEAIKSRRAT